MRGFSIFAPTLSLAALFAASGCGDEPGSGDQLYKKEAALVILEAQLESPTTLVGQPVGVTCLGTFDDSSQKELAPPDVAIAIAPAVDGSQIVDNHVLIPRSGDYQISCTSPAASQIKSASLRVRATIP